MKTKVNKKAAQFDELSKKLHDVSIVMLQVRKWSGAKRLRPEDFPDQDNLPPMEAISLGSKRLIANEHLAPFTRLRQQAITACHEVGVKFWGGSVFAVPNRKMATLKRQLDRISEEFAAEKRKFLMSYDERFERWVTGFPDFEGVLRDSKVTKEYIDNAMSCSFAVCHITPSKDPGEVHKTLAGLTGELLGDIADVATKLFESFPTTRSINQRQIRVLKRLADKVAGLEFLDSGIYPVRAMIEEFVWSVPTDTALDPGQTGRYLALLQTLASPEAVQKIMSAAHDEVRPQEDVDQHPPSTTAGTTVGQGNLFSMPF